MNTEDFWRAVFLSCIKHERLNPTQAANFADKAVVELCARRKNLFDLQRDSEHKNEFPGV